MVKGNNVIANAHFHKVCWQDHVKTWFDQAARKQRTQDKEGIGEARHEHGVERQQSRRA